MSTQELFEWDYSPSNYFEEPFEVVRDDYTMAISPGKVEAWVASNTFSQNPAIRSEMQAFLNDRFLGVQLLVFRPYELSDSRRTCVHLDGRRDVFIEFKGVAAVAAGGTVDIRMTNADGTVYDSKEDRVAAERRLAELVQLHRSSSPALAAMLTSFGNAIRDPQNELVHLYEVRDALSVELGGKSKAIATLGLTSAAWSRLGQLSNEEPLHQGRHRGKSGAALRDATQTELQEAREIARSMLSLYVNHLNGKT
jgi:hypothetical protein